MSGAIRKQEQELAKRELKIASVTASQLARQEVVDAICLEASEAAAREKAAKAEYTEVKDNAKRLFREAFGDYSKCAMFSPENGLKVEQTVKGGGAEIDQEAFLRKLYEHYGEEYGDKTGKAWAAFKRVSVEVECPRVIDPALLDAVYLDESRIASGLSDEESQIPLRIFEESVVEKQPVVAVTAKAMTKAEKSRYAEDPNSFQTVVGL